MVNVDNSLLCKEIKRIHGILKRFHNGDVTVAVAILSVVMGKVGVMFLVQVSWLVVVMMSAMSRIIRSGLNVILRKWIMVVAVAVMEMKRRRRGRRMEEEEKF